MQKSDETVPPAQDNSSDHAHHDGALAKTPTMFQTACDLPNNAGVKSDVAGVAIPSYN